MSLFIVFEGTDGSGQDTQAQLLVDWLKEQYQENVILTREPTDSAIGQEIRTILRHEQPNPGAAKVQALMIKDRRLHQQEIKQYLDGHKIVVCVRYFYSTLAYGCADGLDGETLWDKNKDFLRPNLTIFLDLDPEISMQRIASRGMGTELFECKEFLSEVRRNFLQLSCRNDFSEMQVVNASGSIDGVHQVIVRLVQNKFLLRFPIPTN